jgi:hypothetical protein
VAVDSTKRMELNIALYLIMQEVSDSQESTVKHLVIPLKCIRIHKFKIITEYRENLGAG